MTKPVRVFAGPGNNGGDALAVSRLLLNQGISSHVYMCRFGTSLSADCMINFNRLQAYADSQIVDIHKGQAMPPCDGLIIDGILGCGLNRPIIGYWATLIKRINEDANHIISIDIPSGYYADGHQKGLSCIKAHEVISFEMPKLSFLLPESQDAIESFKIVKIGLDTTAIDQAHTENYVLESKDISSILRPKRKFAHKGSHGKACLVGGHSGMVGALSLAGRSAAASGCGYVYYQSHFSQKEILTGLHPSAIVLGSPAASEKTAHSISIHPDMHYGIGCGMGTSPYSREGLNSFIKVWHKPMVLDADALNLLASMKYFTKIGMQQSYPDTMIPPHSILTPHLKEFDRLFGMHESQLERIHTARKMALLHQIIICIKGAHTAIILPDQRCLFNNTGNAGMATAGSGDVLTGMTTSFLAQGYKPEDAAVLAVHLHGYAGDLSADCVGRYGMSAEDIITFIPQAITEHLC